MPQEINRKVTVGDILKGTGCAILAGLALGGWLWLCLGWGVG
jgi:hypothetical protein